MRVSIAGIGKLVGLAAGLVLLVLLVLWARANYAIEGRIVVEEGSAAGPARHVEVRLISKNYEQTVAQLARQYEQEQERVLSAVVTQLLTKVNDIPVVTNGSRTAGELALEELAPAAARSAAVALREEHPDVQRLAKALEKELGPLSDDERREVSARLRRYLEYSLYCRDAMKAAPIGARFYERGAQYWEERADQLKNTGRVLIDDAACTYVTEWMSGGLGDEPVQRVTRVVRTNEALLSALKRVQARGRTVPATQREEKAKSPQRRYGGLLPQSSLTSNDLQTAVIAAQRELQRSYEAMMRAAEEALLDETLDTTTTDDDGRFVFRGEAVQPGSYLIFAKYEIVSLEGEQLQLVWFEPVTITLRRFAFNKATRLQLTELTQRRPAVMELRVPTQDGLSASVLQRLREALKISG
ncbi:MAG: hypothetical protein N2595_06860 [bacterium]|nr:hypothetical protein [bacterium]